MTPLSSDATSEAQAMHADSSITAVSWIPAGSVTGLARVPFSPGLTRGSIREVNRLKAWIEVRDERIVDAGYGVPGGFVGSTRLDLGFTEVQVPGRARPLLRRLPAVPGRSARCIQPLGARPGSPLPRLTLRP